MSAESAGFLKAYDGNPFQRVHSISTFHPLSISGVWRIHIMRWRAPFRSVDVLKRRERAGFTLIELLLVVSLTLLLASLAGPSLKGVLEKTAERQALSQPVEFIKDAQSRARSQLVSVTVATSGAGFTRTDAKGGTITVPFDARLYAVNIQTLGGELRFNTQGGLESLTPVVVTVVTRSGTQKRYTIMPAIGTIRED